MKRYRLPSLLDDVPNFGPPSRGYGGPHPPPRNFGGPPRGFGPPSRSFDGPQRGFGPRFGDYDEDYGPPARFPRRDLPMSPFLKRMMMDNDYFDGPMNNDYYEEPVNIPCKEDILMDLGQSVIESLKGGRKLSENPVIREKIETLLQVEAGGPPPPPLPARGAHSRYDTFYEQEFVPPAPEAMGGPFRGPGPRGPPGFSGPIRGPSAFPGPKGGLSSFPPAARRDPPAFPAPTGGLTSYPPQGMYKEWYKFSRVGKERDPHRIFATEQELADYFALKKTKGPLNLDSKLRERLRNSFAYEIAQCTNEKRRNFLSANYNKIKNEPDLLFKLDPALRNKDADRKRAKRETAHKKMKKLLRDKRPQQTREERTITNYLKFLLFELCGEEEKQHAVLVLRAIHLNPNMIKCLMTECKNYLDKKFGSEKDLATCNKKRAFLISAHQKHMEDTRRALLAVNKVQAAKEVNDIIYVKYDELLCGKREELEAFATPEHFIMEPEKTQDEFIVDLKYDFVKIAFEKFYFKVVESFCVTKDRRKRINFFMNNGFLAGLIVMGGKGQTYHLPNVAMKYITNMDRPCREASERVDGKLLEKAKTMVDYVVETNPSDFTKGHSMTTEQLQLFNQCVRMFDLKATVTKIQLVDYTPYIRLTREHKLYVFNEIMKFVYLQCIGYISNNVNYLTKQYTEMEKDDA